MKRASLFGILLLLSGTLSLWGMTARQIIRNIDQRKGFRTSWFKAGMTIKKGNRTLIKKFEGYGERGRDRFFMKFTNPEDRNVKYLKTKDNLWIYLPDADDILKISGHMLRRGMMGSDISYEDLLSFDDFDTKYTAELKGSKTIDGTDCYEILVTAKRDDLSYHQQRLLVDKQRFVTLEMEMYARSGRLLKKMKHSDFKQTAGFYFPTKVEVRDMRRKDSVTMVEYKEIKLNIPVPAQIFTRRNLYR